MNTSVYTPITSAKTIARGYNRNSGIRKEISTSRNVIRRGDRMFARLMMGTRTVAEFMSDEIETMSDIIGELRHLCFGQKGLCKLFVRNHSRGWSIERPMMLYSLDIPRVATHEATGGLRLHTTSASAAMLNSRPHTPFPWETH